MQTTTTLGLNQLAIDIYQANKAKGFWGDTPDDRNQGELIALMHSELSEMLEAIRHGNPPSSKIPSHSLLEEELADVIVRALDFAGAYGLDVEGAIVAKLEYNRNRPHKHGKAF